MREALNKVIAELEERNQATVQMMRGSPVGSSMRTEAYGRLSEILYLTDKLKEVLNTDVPTSNRQTSSSSTDDATK